MILVMAPHADDAELGMGGTIYKLFRAREQITIVMFSLGFATDAETACSDAKLKTDRILLDFPNRCFPDYRQAILDKMEELKEKHKPTSVYVPARVDTHQDHFTVTQEAIRCFKMNANLYGYELPWNSLGSVRLQRFEALETVDIEYKIHSLLCYESQSAKVYTDPRFIKALALVRAVQMGRVGYAEAFEVIRELDG